MAGQQFQYDDSGNTFFYFLTSFVGLIVIPATYYLWPRDQHAGERPCPGARPPPPLSPLTFPRAAAEQTGAGPGRVSRRAGPAAAPLRSAPRGSRPALREALRSAAPGAAGLAGVSHLAVPGGKRGVRAGSAPLSCRVIAALGNNALFGYLKKKKNKKIPVVF